MFSCRTQTCHEATGGTLFLTAAVLNLRQITSAALSLYYLPYRRDGEVAAPAGGHAKRRAGTRNRDHRPGVLVLLFGAKGVHPSLITYYKAGKTKAVGIGINVYKILFENTNGRDHLGDPGIHDGIILKRINGM